MKCIFKYLFTLLALSLYSCTEDKFVECEPQMVVEGWIDAGGYPVVMLSQIIPVSNRTISTENLKDYVINWGKVSISDGEETVVLTGNKTNKYFPPYIYTTNKMRGEEGKTYYLTAEYKNFYATARTTIPPKVKINSISTSYSDGKYSINATFNDKQNEKNYYKFFIKVIGRDSCYLSSNLAIIDDKDYDFPMDMQMQVGYSTLYDNNRNMYNLSEADRLMIKIAQIDKEAYDFWDDYKNILELGQNPFFRYTNSIRSNISGGLGYWIGYGATEYVCEPYRHTSPVELKK